MRIGGFLVLAAWLGVDVLGYAVQNAKVQLPRSLGLSMHAFAPNAINSAESFPVIYFATGFGCAVPPTAYSKLLSAIASQGYIIAGLFHEFPHVPSYLRDGHHLHDILEWGKSNLAAALTDAKLSAVPDATGRVAVMGQSAGNHVAGEALTDGCSVAKAFIMIDPVDGFDPYRIIKGEDLINPGEKVKFAIPALLIDNGLDPKTVNKWFPPCAPARLSNDHFYDAWTAPIWNINATAYGHVDCTDHPNGFMCPSNKTLDMDLYRDMIAEAVTLFLGALFDDKPGQLALLESWSHWKIDTVLKHDLKGKNYSQVKPGCVNAASAPISIV